jgi:hypothetical protein
VQSTISVSDDDTPTGNEKVSRDKPVDWPAGTCVSRCCLPVITPPFDVFSSSVSDGPSIRHRWRFARMVFGKP